MPMPKPLKWTLVAAAAILATVLVGVLALSFKGAARLSRAYEIDVANVDVPSDSASIARGRHLAEAVTLCHSCHGADLSGDLLFEEDGIATLYASNLTAGRGGIGARYTDVDHVRAIRHGVSPDGRGLMIMHSDAYNRLGADDVGAIVAYVKSVPPVDNEIPGLSTTFVGRTMLGLGLFDSESMPLFTAEVIDHSEPVPEVPEPGVTAEYGGYLVSIAMCRMCHGAELAGGPPLEPGAAPPPDITVYGVEGGWSEEQFIQTLRSGTTPYGKALNSEQMPFDAYGKMTDDELRAIRRYLADIGPGGTNR